MKQEIKISIIVSLSILILIWGISYLKGNDLFTTDNYFYAQYSDIQGLKVSSPVMLNGFKIGYVKQLALSNNAENKVEAELAILKKYTLPADSKALIYSVDLMGTKAVKIELGKSKKNLEDGSKIEAGIESDLFAQILPLKDDLSKILKSVDTLVQSISNVLDSAAQADLKQSMSNLNSGSNELKMLLQSERNRLKSILSHIDSVSGMLKNNSKNLSNAMKNFSNISDSLAQANLKQTVENANKTLLLTAEVMQKINSGKGTLGALVHNDSLYTNLKNTTENLNLLLKDMKENPKRYVHFSLIDKNKEEK